MGRTYNGPDARTGAAGAGNAIADGRFGSHNTAAKSAPESSRRPEAKLLAAKLWEKTSAAGNRYFVGRLGGVRILILENRDRGGEGEPDWHLFFADGSPQQRGGAP